MIFYSIHLHAGMKAAGAAILANPSNSTNGVAITKGPKHFYGNTIDVRI